MIETLLTLVILAGLVVAAYYYKRGQRKRDLTFKGMQQDAERQRLERQHGRAFGIVDSPKSQISLYKKPREKLSRKSGPGVRAPQLGRPTTPNARAAIVGSRAGARNTGGRSLESNHSQRREADSSGDLLLGGIVGYAIGSMTSGNANASDNRTDSFSGGGGSFGGGGASSSWEDSSSSSSGYDSSSTSDSGSSDSSSSD